MPPLKTILLLTLVGLLNLSTVAPDSAGIVEMVNGLAYGGIPYGSVTGMVAKYPGFMNQQINNLQTPQLHGLAGVQPIGVAPNYRAAPSVGVRPQTVQIYNLPGLVGFYK
ncbi:uncharacterized protein LOC116430843 [Nomia melanderi]|uniref:uncharacterized protein LOC116430843 n=1 Tax=Nomia melanderi TaxID=2448451 RepID=UPI0013044035|nr:uncharacterized protein LOC116430843 [Nomia melanderi]